MAENRQPLKGDEDRDKEAKEDKPGRAMSLMELGNDDEDDEDDEDEEDDVQVQDTDVQMDSKGSGAAKGGTSV